MRLSCALNHVELELAELRDDPQRPVLRMARVFEATHAPYIGFNRAQAAVIEGAILVSRLRMLRCWAGTTDMSFDGSPIIGPTPVDGLYLNGGWCYGGFKATPGSERLYAHLLAKLGTKGDHYRQQKSSRMAHESYLFRFELTFLDAEMQRTHRFRFIVSEVASDGKGTK